MKKLAVLTLSVCAIVAGTLMISTSDADAHGKKRVFRSHLGGHAEVPAVVTPGHGHLWMKVDKEERTIEYKLRYGGIATAVTQVHIHLGQPGVNGGASVFLCDSDTTPDPTDLAPPCGLEGAEGVISADNVIGPIEQGIGPGEIGKLAHAMRHKVTYVNVHTEAFPSGEIRGRIR